MVRNSDFFAFRPLSHMREECPVVGRGSGDLLVDKVMEILEPWSAGTLAGDPSPWSRPGARCCAHACPPHPPQPQPSRRHRHHFVILPSLLTASCRGDQEGGRQEAEKGDACSQQCQGKDTASSGHKASADTSKDAAGSSGKTPEECPWQFSVDMKGCDEVRATTEGGLLVVEGRGSSSTSQQLVRHITSLPRHATHDALTATLNHGRLTVTLKAATQLQGQARTLPIDVLQQKEPECTEQQQQMTSESTQQQQQQQQKAPAEAEEQQQQQKAPEAEEQQQQQKAPEAEKQQQQQKAPEAGEQQQQQKAAEAEEQQQQQQQSEAAENTQ